MTRKTVFKRLPYFKALTIDDKRWVEGGIVHVTKTYKGEEDEQDCDIWQIVDKEGVGFNIDKDTICQYIGQKDRNDNRVFENDILEWRSIKHNTDVQICIKCMIIQGKIGWKVKTLKLENSVRRNAPLGIISISTVIGNAITNPELLEGKTLNNLLDRRLYGSNDNLTD